jgi:hypothetical protein
MGQRSHPRRTIADCVSLTLGIDRRCTSTFIQLVAKLPVGHYTGLRYTLAETDTVAGLLG